MPNVLLIEDNPGDARLISELLKDADDLSNEHTITHVERVASAIDLLSKPHDFDIILSDITLPDSEGVETLSAFSEAAIDLPVLFMTGTNDEALALEALHHGAQDYLIKGRYNGNALSRAITYAIERKNVQKSIDHIKAEALANRQRAEMLAEQKQHLVELSNAKDEFVSLASHQLRTPATAVKQYLGMILEGHIGTVDDAARDLLKTAYESNERQLVIINELLRTARLDSNNLQLSFTSEKLGDLVDEIGEELRPTLEVKGQTFTVSKRSDPYIQIDRNEIKLVLTNLIENASKYSPHNTLIAVRIERLNGDVLVEVQDHGVGISKKDQARIFDKFTRVDNELSDTVMGNGLGLYWAKRIIRLHKGEIVVRSEPKVGSTFAVRLPL